MATFKDLLAQTSASTAGRQETPFADAFKILIQNAMQMGQEKRANTRQIEGEQRAEQATIRAEGRGFETKKKLNELSAQQEMDLEKLKQQAGPQATYSAIQKSKSIGAAIEYGVGTIKGEFGMDKTINIDTLDKAIEFIINQGGDPEDPIIKEKLEKKFGVTGSGDVRMKAPDGSLRDVPSNEVEAATAAGYERI